MADKVKDLWEYYAENAPYFAVSTFDKFKNENLNAEALEQFFAAGEEYVKSLWGEISRTFEGDFRPETALDFGCGVGRVTLPLASRTKRVVGVDISPKMLAEAEKNSEKLGLKNTSFILNDENFDKLDERFDFVHSFIVIQHIEPVSGEMIFQKLINLVKDNGIGILHLTYNHPGKRLSKWRLNLYLRFPALYFFRNKLRKEKSEPLIPIYVYNLNRIFKILQENQCLRCLVRFSEHGHQGVLIFFQKKREEVF